jgi:Domain of unknown function (DUF1998)
MATRKVRRSQVVSPFGPGAIIDLVGESFVAEDAGNWRGRPELINFPRLAAYLEVPALRTPPAGGALPYYRFPQWLFCPHCRRMTRWSITQEGKDSAPTCQRCLERRRLVPMRFVAVCANGHLADIDWRRWAHSEARRDRDKSQCQSSDKLRFVNRSDVGGGLRSLEVICDQCHASRSLDNLTSRIALRQIGIPCPGRQPWQNQQDARACDEALVALQRGASSVYFPEVVSAIDIPPESTWTYKNDPGRKLLQHSDFRSLVERPDHPLRSPLLDVIAKDTGLARVDVERELTRELGGDAPRGVEGSLDDIPPDEWEALCTPTEGHDPRDLFITRRAPRGVSSGDDRDAQAVLDQKIEDVVLVDRLREVRVLTEFRRHTMKRAVRSNLAAHVEHLPAVEVFGEGFFVRFEEDIFGAWESHSKVRERCQKLATRAQAASAHWLEVPTPRYVLLHTLAHLLLRNTAFEAGYSTSSLRERLYATRGTKKPEMAGILIYTAAGDTEGTLGGLVRMGEHERLSRLIFASIVSAQWCSFDPVCTDSLGQGPSGLSLAACHACSLVPETSCVATNRLLDRRLVVDPEFGFFADVVARLNQAPSAGVW